MNMYNSADDFDLYVTYPHLNMYKEKEYLSIKVMAIGFSLLFCTLILFFKMERKKIITNCDINDNKDSSV